MRNFLEFLPGDRVILRDQSKRLSTEAGYVSAINVSYVTVEWDDGSTSVVLAHCGVLEKIPDWNEISSNHWLSESSEITFS